MGFVRLCRNQIKENAKTFHVPLHLGRLRFFYKPVSLHKNSAGVFIVEPYAEFWSEFRFFKPIIHYFYVRRRQYKKSVAVFPRIFARSFVYESIVREYYVLG